jgi:hypothetical protein
MKRILFAAALLCAAAPAVPAAADVPPEKKAAAQAEVDKVKADTCLKTQAFIAKQKDKCPDAAAEAAKLACTAADFKRMNELNTACLQAMTAPKTKSGTTAPATAPADVAPASSCSAADEDGNVIATATADKATDCRNQIKEAVSKAKCTEGVKKFKFMYSRGGAKPSSSTVFCKK